MGICVCIECVAGFLRQDSGVTSSKRRAACVCVYVTTSVRSGGMFYIPHSGMC